jgi:hypothetical protein
VAVLDQIYSILFCFFVRPYYGRTQKNCTAVVMYLTQCMKKRKSQTRTEVQYMHTLYCSSHCQKDSKTILSNRETSQTMDSHCFSQAAHHCLRASSKKRHQTTSTNTPNQPSEPSSEYRMLNG